MKQQLQLSLILAISAMLILSCIPLIPSASAVTTFGRTDTGNATGAIAANYKFASKFTAPQNGQISKLTIRAAGDSAGNIRCAIYADASGQPGALIAQTNAVSIGTTMAWIDCTFSNAVSVTANTPYWLTALRDVPGPYRVSTSTSNFRYNADVYSDGFSNPFGAGTSVSYELCIYATYSEGQSDQITEAIDLGLDWLDRMVYKEIGNAGKLTLTDTNIIENPGFENALQGTWNVEYPTDAFRTTSRKYSGYYSLQLNSRSDDYVWATQDFTEDFSTMRLDFYLYIDSHGENDFGSHSRSNAIGGAIIIGDPLQEIQFGYVSKPGSYEYLYLDYFKGMTNDGSAELSVGNPADLWKKLTVKVLPQSMFSQYYNIELYENDVLKLTLYNKTIEGILDSSTNSVEFFNDAYESYGPLLFDPTAYIDEVICKVDGVYGVAVAIESPSLSFRMKRSDGYWTIFGKRTDKNLPPSATMIRGGCTDPQATTDDLNLITGEIDNQRMKYYWDIDGDGEYDDVTLYVEYATMDNDDTRVAGKIVQYANTGVSLQLYLEFEQVISSVSLNQQFSRDKQWGWAGRRYTIRPTTKGLADLYVWLATTQFSWLGGQTYQQTRGINYTDRALKLYRTWYGSGYIIDRFDGHYGATVNVRPWAGQYGIPNYPANPDLILEPWDTILWDYGTYYVDSPSSNWHSYANVPTMYGRYDDSVLRHTAVSRHIMPENEEWPKCPFQCSDTQFIYAYKSRTGFEWARNKYIANGFEFDLINYQNMNQGDILPFLDVCLGIGTDAKSIRACHDMYKYGSNIPYGLNTLKAEFIDSATWDGNGIAFDSWRGTSLGWPYPAYGTHNTATYGNALIQYYKLTSDSNIGAKADQVIGVLLMLQNKLGQSVFSRSKTQSYYRAEFVGSFLPGYAVAYSFGQQDIYSAPWADAIYAALAWDWWGLTEATFELDPQSTSYPCMGNAECTIPSVWTLIQYKTTGRTPVSPPEQGYVLSFQDNVVAYTDHGGSWGGDGNIEIVSPNAQSTYIGGETGNLYRHTGKLDRIRMYAQAGGDGWASIQYEWNFTLANAVTDWRAKVYFTVPDYYAFRVAGENSLTMTVSLYNSGGQLITEDSRIPLQNLHGSTRQSGAGGKMVIYNDTAQVASLTAGTYTVKLKFRVYSGGAESTEIFLGYVTEWDIKPALPMGLEYFGYDCSAAPSGEETFGRTTEGDATGAIAGNYKFGSKYMATENGYVTKLTVRIAGDSPGYLKCAIYADSSGEPGALLGTTNAVALGTTMSWVDCPLSSPVPVTSGTYYWLIALKSVSGSYRVAMDPFYQNFRYNYNSYGDPFANPFGVGARVSYALCIYATYYT